jgi:hypothetical protein
MRTKLIALSIAFFCLMLVCPTCRASLTVFNAGDPGVGPTDPWLNSAASAAAFDAVALTLGTENIINFEAFPVANYSTFTVADGVIMTGARMGGVDQELRDINDYIWMGPANYGFNTTPGGSKYMFLNGGYLTFTFSNPICAFGVYLTGYTSEGEVVTFNDGISQSISITKVFIYLSQ